METVKKWFGGLVILLAIAVVVVGISAIVTRPVPVDCNLVTKELEAFHLCSNIETCNMTLDDMREGLVVRERFVQYCVGVQS